MSAPQSTRPNVLVMMSDQHSKHYLGCYGHPLVRTPHLDELAQRGTRFTNAYCPSPLCVPSRTSFLTARTPSASQVWKNSHILPSSTPTWAHALGAAGYETALIGRMHFLGPDQRHGFERRPMGEYCAYHPGVGYQGAPLMSPALRGSSGQTRRAVEVAGWGHTTYQDFDERVARTTCAYLRAQAEDNSRPFAAVIGFLLPHCPFVAPRELFEYYYARVDVPQQTDLERQREPAAVVRFKKLRGIYDPLPPARIRAARAAYLGMCEHLDRQIGHILQALEDTGLAENTLVIYTSDHGEMAGEHGCWWKSNYYEGSVGVPLIASLPGVVPQGQASEAICNLMDLGPTLLDVAGADPMPAVDGRSLWPVLQGDPSAQLAEETYSEHFGGTDGVPSRMIRRGPWKLFKYHDHTPPALYNLAQDPDENNDLGLDPHYEGVRQELLASLYQGWDPARVLEQTASLDRDERLLARWGQAVRLLTADQLLVPDVEDVTLV